MTRNERSTQQYIRRGSFSSVKELIAKIQQYIDHYNQHFAKPFIWTDTAEFIFVKLERLCSAISWTRE